MLEGTATTSGLDDLSVGAPESRIPAQMAGIQSVELSLPSPDQVVDASEELEQKTYSPEILALRMQAQHAWFSLLALTGKFESEGSSEQIVSNAMDTVDFYSELFATLFDGEPIPIDTEAKAVLAKINRIEHLSDEIIGAYLITRLKLLKYMIAAEIVASTEEFVRNYDDLLLFLATFADMESLRGLDARVHEMRGDSEPALTIARRLEIVNERGRQGNRDSSYK